MSIYSKTLDETLETLGDEPVESTLKSVMEKNSVNAEQFDGLYDEIEGDGPIRPLLADPQVSEVLINGAQSIFFEKNGELSKSPTSFTSDRTYRRYVQRLLQKIDKAVDSRHPMTDGHLEDGSRVHVTVFPITRNPVICIRRHVYSQWSLQDLEDKQMLCPKRSAILKSWIATRKNFIVCGATASGKTTLIRALLNEIDTSERLLTLEDAPELQLRRDSSVSLLTRTDPDGLVPSVTLSTLIRHAMRMRPDRLILGEVRGEEACLLLDAMATGHRGSIGSLHAHSAKSAMARLEALVLRGVPHWPLTAIRQMMYEALDGVVFVGRHLGVRKVLEISEISGLESFGFLFNPLFSQQPSD